MLNVATTRLILTRAAADGQWAAGGVVWTFGRFVTGGATGADNIVVGLVIFSIIVLIQFVVITKGATRISEVAARFTLDGMPGQADGHRRRPGRRRDRPARKPSAAAAKSPSRPTSSARWTAPASSSAATPSPALVIILINIIGGLFIGIVQNGMSLSEAGSLFTTLTIGDGLVTQVPAFLISLAAGMLVTRSNQESNLPSEFLRQLFLRPQALAVAGGFLGILIFTSLPRDSAAADRRRPARRWP